MDGQMQDWPLTIPYILKYANRWHSEQQIVCQTVEGPVVISTYADLHRRSQLCALALVSLGVKTGDIVATLAWNTTRHMEVWYGTMGIGAVCHTLNPRLSDTDLIYIINHAGDMHIMADITFVPVLQRILKDCPSVKGVTLLTDRQHMPRGHGSPTSFLCYEELLDRQVGALPFSWPDLDENLAAGLCYTSGTTGRPKGVLYSHRSNFLHALISTSMDAVPLNSASVALAVVPMFHANAWGLPFVAPMTGARLVMPGPHLDGASIYKLLTDHKVTITAGVPTVWLNLLAYMEEHQLALSHLKLVIIGGAAASRSMIETFQFRYGIRVHHMWGMTEISPLGTLGGVKGALVERGLLDEEEVDVKLMQGRPHLFCDMRIVNDEGKELPRDGQTVGHLQVRGPIVVDQYFRLAPGQSTCVEGRWFPTGDVASLDVLGHMKITDRSKDVIKSGGEWISSIDIENHAMSHPAVMEAAVVAIADEVWGERPLLVVVPKNRIGDEALKRDLLSFLSEKLAKYAVPDDVVFVPDIPHNATGKVSKLTLREMFRHHKPPRSNI